MLKRTLSWVWYDLVFSHGINMTLFSVSTSPSLPGLVRRHLSLHLKFSPCPRWCASSNKEFLLLCQPLPLLLCRSNSPSSSERCRPHRRRGHPDPGSPRKVTDVDFFYGRLSLKKNWSSFLSATGHAAGHDILTQARKSLTKFEQDTSERGLPAS